MIAVLPAPVLPRSHTTGAVTWARVRTCSISAGELPVSPKSAPLMAFQSRFSATVKRPQVSRAMARSSAIPNEIGSAAG
jgi:hypothetical protein